MLRKNTSTKQLNAVRTQPTDCTGLLFGIGFALCALLALYTPTTLAAPSTYSAEFQATIKGMGVRMHRNFAVTDGHAVVSNKAKKLIFALEESSQLKIEDGKQLRVLNYRHKRKNLGTRHNRDLVFDWEKNQVSDRLRPENKPLAIEHPIYDKISYQEQFRLDLSNNPDVERLVYQVTEGQRTRPYAFDRIGEEQIDTPLGILNTVKFKRDRGPNSDRETYIWFASDWSYMLARLDQIESKGSKTERLELRRAKIDGVKVKGL